MTTEYEFQDKCAKLVQVEVYATISNLVHTLAKSYGSVDSRDRDLCDLTEQAFELARNIEDWESAAEEAGWTKYESDKSSTGEVWGRGDETADNAQEACEVSNIDPHEHEVYEHWIVSDWLAARLEEKGERIDHDFTGLTVWGRTTTGQAISMDYVIRQIVRDLHNLEAEA